VVETLPRAIDLKARSSVPPDGHEKGTEVFMPARQDHQSRCLASGTNPARIPAPQFSNTKVAADGAGLRGDSIA